MQGQQSQTGETAERSLWADNARGLLIVLVIWGHLIEKVALGDPVIKGAYGALYLFHIPAFAMICGLYSPLVMTRHGLRRIFTRLLVPLVLFQLLYWPVLAFLAPAKIISPLAPFWLLWFLLSLACWRVMAPVFARLPHALLLAVLLALAAGYVEPIGREFSLSRTLFFFPAFLAGYLYRDRLAAFVTRYRALCLVALLVLTALAFWLAASGVSVKPLYGRESFARLPAMPVPDLLVRLAVIIGGLVAAIGFFALVPPGRSILAGPGRQTLGIYLLHGFVVLVLRAVMGPEAPLAAIPFLALSLITSLGIALLLARLPALPFR